MPRCGTPVESTPMQDAKMSGTGTSSQPPEDLPYRIELWQHAGGNDIERVLARAASAELARAIFKAARQEQPDRRITLSMGNRIIADTSA
jgi:hypothetical protein